MVPRSAFGRPIVWLAPLVFLSLVFWWQREPTRAHSFLGQMPQSSRQADASTLGATVTGIATEQMPQSGRQADARAEADPLMLAQLEAAPMATSLVASFPFYGSTPTLAWSPDGRRLAFVAAYEYFGYESQIASFRDQLGLWVYERDTNATRNLLKEQRYHPAWLGNELIATACSPYESCTEGLYLTGLDGTNRLALLASVYHTLAVNDHEVLFYNGFSGETRWNRFDIVTSIREHDVSEACSWEPPAELYMDQCLQQVGDVSVTADMANGLWVQIGGSDPVLVDSLVPFNFSTGTWACGSDHTGPVAPCLSPDGRTVAYVAAGETGAILRIHNLPETAEELASLHQGAFAIGTVRPTPGTSAVELEGIGIELGTPGAEGITLGSLAQPGQMLGLDGVSGGLGYAGTLPPGPDGTLVWPAQVLPLEARTITGQPAGRSREILAFDFYGDTPSLAWSPDGRLLAFNSAYRASVFYEGEGAGYTNNLTTAGLWIADPERRTATRIVGEARYHPTWLGDRGVASACSMWESCSPGLLLSDVDGGTSRLLLAENVYNPHAVSEHELVFFSDLDGAWHRLDIDTQTRGPVSTGSCSWEPPVGLALDQCVQEIGNVRVWVQVPTGLYAQVGNAAPVRIDPSPPWLFDDVGVWGCPRSDYSGAIPPCLSPDGQRVAYITRSVTGLSLHLVDIP